MISPLAKHLKPISRDDVARIAIIFGPTSAAQRSLDDLDSRLNRGEIAEIFLCGEMFVIGPRPAGMEAA